MSSDQKLAEQPSACVLYVLPAGQTALGGSCFEQAQAFALRLQLPLAVVYCLEKWNEEAMNSLENVEQELLSVHIPLLVLVGKADMTLAGLIHHTKPHKVFYATTPQVKPHLQLHPYAWPGPILSIAKLRDLMATGQLVC